ncbi:MAG: hypothetical protein ACREBF_04995 [Candidatus Micrarchaeales archaeon]
MYLYLDVVHELMHIKQWRNGIDLFDKRFAYADRPTEIEAYKVAAREARRLGMKEKELRKYLEVDWVSDEDSACLLSKLGVR